MLKGLDPLLSPELLRVLRAMGHGDEIAVVDANYPAASAGPPVVRLAGAGTTEAANAILSVMPLDEFAPEAVWCMAVVGEPDGEQPIFGEFRATIRRFEGEAFRLAKLERFAFYARASEAFAIVSTGERRLYGNLIMKKGVVRSD